MKERRKHGVSNWRNSKRYKLKISTLTQKLNTGVREDGKLTLWRCIRQKRENKGYFLRPTLSKVIDKVLKKSNVYTSQFDRGTLGLTRWIRCYSPSYKTVHVISWWIYPKRCRIYNLTFFYLEIIITPGEIDLVGI